MVQREYIRGPYQSSVQLTDCSQKMTMQAVFTKYTENAIKRQSAYAYLCIDVYLKENIIIKQIFLLSIISIRIDCRIDLVRNLHPSMFHGFK